MRPSHRPTSGERQIGLGQVLMACCLWAGATPAQEVDLSKLPAPAQGTVEFARDIEPILAGKCFQCHGPERPKSGFRLDRRDQALLGGDAGVAIVPGDSAGSPLIHYVAWLVEDMGMPPPGKADRLTPEEIALLRAWIDQGLVWADPKPLIRHEATFAPMFGWFFVDGDTARFREHHWVQEGAQGGVEKFLMLDRLDERVSVTLDGHALRDDYRVDLEWKRLDLGFLRGGYSEYRHYYDDSGGYDRALTPSEFDLDRDLALELGKAWVEAGLTRPELPWITLGYEYHFRQGDKSTLQWLPDPNTSTRALYPAAKDVDEDRHVLRADAGYAVAGVDLKDAFRYEFYDVNTDRLGSYPDGPSGVFVETGEGTDYRQLANAFTLEKQLKDWLLISGGYLYTDLDGEASFRQSTFDGAGAPIPGGIFWSGNDITLDQRSHTANLNTQFGPWAGTSLYIGVQPEWSRQEGFGLVRLSDGTPFTSTNAAVIDANYDRVALDETAGLRMALVPHSILFLEGRWRQESLSQYEESLGGVTPFQEDYRRDTDALNLLEDYRAGFQTSPFRSMSLSVQYRKRVKKNDYDHDLDERPIGSSGLGTYSAFILEQEFDTDEFETKLVLRPRSWLKTTLAYRLQATDYETETQPPFGAPHGDLGEAGNYDANIYSLGVVVTPWSRLYFSSTLSLADTRMVTFDNGVDSIVPYQGQVYAILSSLTYLVSDKSEFMAAYNFSHGNYDQNNDGAGLPLGLRYYQHSVLTGFKRRVTDQLTGRLQYAFFQYDEPSGGYQNDYVAHGVFATLDLRFP